MKIFWPHYYTEAHRRPHEGQALAEELNKLGCECSSEITDDCDFVFCGGMLQMPAAEAAMKIAKRARLVHYCWDLYPFQLEPWEPEIRTDVDYWKPYVESLKTCLDVWVPSRCTVRRIEEFTGRSAQVILTSVRPWSIDLQFTEPGDYVVDVMRKYPDPNRYAVRRACESLGIKCIETQNKMPWEKFKQTIAGARLLVSANWECSTGGLTLLEGYWHGVPALISDSPRHGGSDYLGNHAIYFRWDDPNNLREMIKYFAKTARIDPTKTRPWITENFSEAAMAKRMVDRFKELLDV